MANRIATLVVGIAVFAVVGAILLQPVASVTEANTGTVEVTNETVYANYNESVDLRGYDVNPGTDTVWVENDSGTYVEASSPDDYTLNEGDGSLDFNSSSTLVQSGEEVKVSYDYQASDELSALVLGFAPLALGLLIFAKVADAATGAM